MRLTLRTNLAMRVLMACAVNEGRMLRRVDVAEMICASEHHLAQVIHLLSQAGFLKTMRGRTGGFQLAHSAQDISIGQVFRTFEEVLPFVECFDTKANACPLSDACLLKPALNAALTAFYEVLDQITLHYLVAENMPLEQLLAMHPPSRCMAANPVH